ncbi:uncharacterized protein LOC125429939 isoform X2 [Sphaerodactylus townsendi]|uniref:uncharacterized protein LOC125429939 isoform X2 n=1 Tax=Sphaerodactylus townsendi TaxID=933632 RepID=UPI002026B30D|nr:uncharacterized protein LOC125429939 isoform X2 [Sphaerodactylus townsendi]
MSEQSEAPSHAPTTSVPMDNNVVAIIIATISTSVFIVAILVLLLLLYHRDPLCCQFLCSCRFFQNPSRYDCPPPYFSSNQRLVGLQSGTQRLENTAENPGTVQGDELFCVGPPSSYQLPPWEQPRLPSYESVRKKDRQREIHQMIAERFGLWADVSQELPPPYEQALRYPATLSGAGSELSARQSLPDMLQASPMFQPHRNTSV